MTRWSSPTTTLRWPPLRGDLPSRSPQRPAPDLLVHALGLEGLSDAEYLWEPAPGSWNVRLHADGNWKRDAGASPVVPTIGWRLCTLAGTQTLRADWTFGGHRLQWTDIDLPGSAAGAEITLLRDLHRCRPG